MGFTEVFWMMVLAWKSFGGGPFLGVGWDIAVFQGVWRFAIKIAGTSVFAMLLKQVDRILISKMLPLEQLGYYTTAVIAGMGLARVFVPVQAAVFPRLTKQYSVGDQAGLSKTFHSGCQAVAFLVAAPAALLVFFSAEILKFWTKSEECAKHASSPLAITALAMLFNSMMSIPFSLAVGTGMTWLPLWTNGIGVIFLIPLTFFSVKHYGIVGGAWAWLAFNLAYYFIVPHILFRNLLQSEKGRWYFQDTGFFIVVALFLFFIARQISVGLSSILSKGVCIGVAGLAYAAICLLFSPGVRSLSRDIWILRKT
jgi:O-antigen/teichoic acid export membrane protein